MIFRLLRSQLSLTPASWRQARQWPPPSRRAPTTPATCPGAPSPSPRSPRPRRCPSPPPRLWTSTPTSSARRAARTPASSPRSQRSSGRRRSVAECQSTPRAHTRPPWGPTVRGRRQSSLEDTPSEATDPCGGRGRLCQEPNQLVQVNTSNNLKNIILQ